MYILVQKKTKCVFSDAPLHGPKKGKDRYDLGPLQLVLGLGSDAKKIDSPYTSLVVNRERSKGSCTTGEAKTK
jgi:hypothetical protein